MILRARRITQYTIGSPYSRMRLHVEAGGNGSGFVSGWIFRDWRRLDLVDAYLRALPGQLWERGDKEHFVYAFGPRVLSRKTALELNAIMDRDLRRKRTAREAPGKGRR